MLALSGGRYPLVNPAAFHYGGDSVWLTTSRHAAKIALARKRPEASFLVDGRSHSVLLEGSVEVYDPLTVPGQVRAFLEGPGFYLNLAGYALKNAAFIGGYLWDLARIPGDWWPQNRALLRLRGTKAWSLPSVSAPPAEPAPVPVVPAGVRRSLTRVPVAYLCTILGGTPLMAPALWTAQGGDGRGGLSRHRAAGERGHRDRVPPRLSRHQDGGRLPSRPLHGGGGGQARGGRALLPDHAAARDGPALRA